MSLLVQVHKDAKVEYGEAGRASFEGWWRERGR